MWVILQRELLIRGRAWGTWAMRLLVTFAALVVIALYFLIAGLSPGNRGQSGEAVFLVLFYGLMLFCLFEGIRTSALGITEERRDGTLGLLFLTPLSSLDVLLGKLSGAAVTALYGLVAVAPLLSLPLMLGGVTFGEVARATVVLANTLALSLACGLIGSVRSRDAIAAIVRATAWLIALLILPLLLELGWQALDPASFGSRFGPASAASPAVALFLARDAGYASAAGHFWIGQLAILVVAGLLVALAARRLKGTWRQDEPVQPQTATIRPPSHPREATTDGVHTLGTVVARRAGSRRWFWSVIGLGTVANLPNLLMMGSPWMGAFSVVLLPLKLAELASNLVLIYVAARTYAEARQTGEMEILLTTPVDDREIVRTLWLALRPFVVWLTVVNVALNMAGFLIRLCMAFPNPRWGPELGILAGHWVSDGVGTCLFAAACIWVGMWRGLTTSKTGAAVGWTFALVGIVTPVLVTVMGFIAGNLAMMAWMQSIGNDWIAGLGGSDSAWQMLVGLFQQLPGLLLSAAAYLIWIRWARGCLNARFRLEATRAERPAVRWALPTSDPPPLPDR